MEPAQLLKESDDMKFVSNALRMMEETALSRRSRIAEPLPQVFLMALVLHLLLLLELAMILTQWR